ncbi:MAG: EpsI family protein [FCB group bacterium]|nr:EpsI family protein [FCB group bacterium]
MDKKNFAVILIILLVTFSIALVIKYYHPSSKEDVNFDDFPMQLGDWQGERDIIPKYVSDLLNPEDIFSASYTNKDGIRVHLFFDYFSSSATYGGPHSPRNCLPGSGWLITATTKRKINIGDRIISVGRFDLQEDREKQVMDFWYVTNFGETSNDYRFKFYELLSSLTFKPKDIGFIRYIADNDPKSLAALDEFEQLFTKEIYKRLPFQK